MSMWMNKVEMIKLRPSKADGSRMGYWDSAVCSETNLSGWPPSFYLHPGSLPWSGFSPHLSLYVPCHLLFTCLFSVTPTLPTSLNRPIKRCGGAGLVLSSTPALAQWGARAFVLLLSMVFTFHGSSSPQPTVIWKHYIRNARHKQRTGFELWAVLSRVMKTLAVPPGKWISPLSSISALQTLPAC